MKRVLLGCIATVLSVGACATDPTDSLSGGADRIVASFSELTVTKGDSVLVTAETRDRQGVVLPEAPTATSGNTGVATITDASRPPLSQARFYVKGVAAGDAVVTLTSGSVTATIDVTVN